MPDQRRAFKTGNSLVVVVPPLIQSFLDLREGGVVYWHTGSPYEAVLGRSAHRVGGRPAGRALQTEHQRALERIERLKVKLGGRDQAVLHEGKSVGWAEAQKYYSKIEADIAALRAEVRALFAARAADGMPLPSPQLSPPSVAGEAGTPGAEPTGAPKTA